MSAMLGGGENVPGTFRCKKRANKITVKTAKLPFLGWAFVNAYGPGCERSEEERDEFWNDLTRCVDGLSTRNYVVLGDLNARVGDGEVEGVVGKYGVPGENESGERLLDMCVEQECGCWYVCSFFGSSRSGSSERVGK